MNRFWWLPGDGCAADTGPGRSTSVSERDSGAGLGAAATSLTAANSTGRRAVTELSVDLAIRPNAGVTIGVTETAIPAARQGKRDLHDPITRSDNRMARVR